MKMSLIHSIFQWLALCAVLVLAGCKAKPVSWRETFDRESSNPYGTSIISHLLQSYYPNQEFGVLENGLEGQLPGPGAETANYVFIGEAMYLDSLDTRALLNFIRSGHLAFISTKVLPVDLMDAIHPDKCYLRKQQRFEEIETDQTKLIMSHSSLSPDSSFHFQYVRYNKPYNYYWQYLDDDFFCDSPRSLVPAGHMIHLKDSLVNFARIDYGMGRLYLHTTPIAFTNYSLLQTDRLDYAGKVFSHLSPGTIYWDSYSKIPETVGHRLNQSKPNRALNTNNPLQYILSQPALTWAWYLLIAMGILFLVFRSKRRQRVIPIRETNTNNSLEFLGIVSRLYFMQDNYRQYFLRNSKLFNKNWGQNNHKTLAQLKTKLFKTFVKNRYQLQVKDAGDNEALEKLAGKSEIDRHTLHRILTMSKDIEKSSVVSEEDLIEYHNTMDEFYKNCK